MSLSKLSKLPPEVLSPVLNNQAIPLGDRLRLRLISNLWADIIEKGLKKETSLVICDDKAEWLRLKPDLIISSTAQTDEFIGPLSRLFTSLTQLTIDFGDEDSWDTVPSLLAHLNSTKLTAVTLYCSLNEVHVCMQLEPIAIAAALTAFSGLTSLTLVGTELSLHLLPHLKAVLSRLEAFGCLDDSFDSNDLADILPSRLSPRCTHLWLPSSDFKCIEGPFLVQLSRNLTHLHLHHCEDDTIWQSISQMHGLSSLTLEFFGQPDFDSSLFSHLAPFTRLTDVKLLDLSYRTPLALPSKKETRLSTIRRLTLEVLFGNSPVDYQAFFQALSAWFNSLAHLTILTEPDNFAAIRASLGQLPFSVKLVDRELDNTWCPDW